MVAALNGDVDNHAALRAAEGLAIPDEITTDAKVIPALVSRRIAAGDGLEDAFRATVASFEGSVVVSAQVAAAPDRLLLAQRGSGQGLYVGLAEDAFVVASEPYGLVEETSTYLRLDGEATGGQIAVLDAAGAGTIEGISRYAYDGRPVPVEADEKCEAEITTRDIDRRGYPHFLLKEISESPLSIRKTLRGKVRERAGRLSVNLGDATLPPGSDRPDRRRRDPADPRHRPGHRRGGGPGGGRLDRAGPRPDGLAPILVTATPATELSGFALDDDMSDCLVVAVSQSGTTTDTNRTVDLVRGRGATVVGIVNRRNSELVAKSDGVLYTSDGRDVEMSVASTKAFYSQVAAGVILAVALADAAGADEDDAHELLAGLRALPEAMEQVLAGSERWPRWPGPRRRAAGTGRSSGRAPTGWRRPRSGSSCPSSATRPSPATPPRTRSTSTCRRSR